MKTIDEGIQPVRDIRERISTRFDDDPKRMVEHYVVLQEEYRDRLLQAPPAMGALAER